MIINQRTTQKEAKTNKERKQTKTSTKRKFASAFIIVSCVVASDTSLKSHPKTFSSRNPVRESTKLSVRAGVCATALVE